MIFTVEYEQEEDGRWIADVLELPGVMVYGATREEAMAIAQALALRVVSERLDHGEMLAEPLNILFAAA
jgi:predicted RNase H-like HicB family nuclease